MKKVVIFSTGGTIAMKQDPVTGGLVPAVSGKDLVDAIPAMAELGEVDVREFSNVPSGYMTPEMMFRLAGECDRAAADPEVAGIVVTHGTDTLEETAYMLSLATKTEKPVVCTGAMRGSADLSADGPANLFGAVRTAFCPEAAGRGALLVFNDQIHAAEQVMKMHSVSCSTFASPGWGPLGYIYSDRIVFRFRPERVEKIRPERPEYDVALVKACTGMDDFIFRALADRPVAGMVVEAYGCGNVQPAVKKGIEYVRSKGIPVVLATRASSGRVAPVYSYEGSLASMRGSRVIGAGELSSHKARLKLMCVLGLTRDIDTIAGYFDR